MEAFEAMDEVELVRQAVAGSREAFARLVRLHQAAVRWYLVRCVRDPAAADDLAQEVFLCAYQNLATFRSAGSLRGWLIGIARNMAVQHVRTEVRRRRKERGSLSAPLGPMADRAIGRKSRATARTRSGRSRPCEQCIEQLAPESRQRGRRTLLRSPDGGIDRPAAGPRRGGRADDAAADSTSPWRVYPQQAA